MVSLQIPKTFEDYIKNIRIDKERMREDVAKKLVVIEFQEMLTLADDKAYPFGELVTLRRVLTMNPIKEY